MPDPAKPAPDAEPRMRVPASRLLDDFVDQWPEERVHLKDIVAVLGDRGFGLFLLLFAAPNILPSPVPGISAVLGVPLILVAAQLALGHSAPWFPKVIGERSIKTSDFKAVVVRITPWMRRLERLFKPRLRLFSHRKSERCLAGFCLFLAVILTLPIPLGNMPPALSISLIALGLIEHDGVAIVFGLGVGVISIAIVGGVAAAFLTVIPHVLQSLF